MGTGIIPKNELNTKGVLSFQPKKIDIPFSAPAQKFVSHHHGQSEASFRINPLLADQTGISRSQADEVDARVEGLLLEKLKGVQEEGYREGFALGLDDGREKAFAEQTAKIESQLETLNQLSGRIEALIKDLVIQNEAQIIDMIFFLARNIALKEIREKPESIREVLLNVMESVQSDESVTLRVSESDFKHLEQLRKVTPKEFEFLNRLRLAESPEISDGGCVIETNYGMIDACLETRIQKLWDTLQDKKPKIQDQVA